MAEAGGTDGISSAVRKKNGSQCTALFIQCGGQLTHSRSPSWACPEARLLSNPRACHTGNTDHHSSWLSMKWGLLALTFISLILSDFSCVYWHLFMSAGHLPANLPFNYCTNGHCVPSLPHHLRATKGTKPASWGAHVGW